MNISQAFFAAIDNVAKQTIPGEVITRAKRSLLDYLAVTCAGAAFQKQKIEKYFAFAEPEEGALNAIGTGKKLVLKEAVFLNGLNAHALDFDDGTNSGIIHLGSPIFSLLIPLAQRYGKSIDEVLRAAVIGYEASYTMAVSIQPKHKALGFHATGTCGMLGATLAAAYMLEFAEEERYQAFATACVAASGMLKVLDDGSELKPYNVAKTALLSLTSLQLAKSGFKGHADPLGGYRGFLKMMSGDEHTEIKPCLLNGTYAIMKSYTKPYASCRYTHPPVEAAIHLRKQYEITPEQVEHIKVETYDLAVSGHDHTDIKGAYSAKMSTPYSTAVALAFGKVGLQEFEDGVLEDKAIQELTGKVEVVADKGLSEIFPDKQSAVLTITTPKGEYSERVDFPKGEPENPLTDQEFYDRYAALMSYGNIDKAVIDSVYEMVDKPNAKVSELISKL
jgi:2-methylcitrate dehydratase PrpD